MEMLLVLVVIAMPLGLIVLLMWLTLKVKSLTSEINSIKMVLKGLKREDVVEEQHAPVVDRFEQKSSAASDVQYTDAT